MKLFHAPSRLLDMGKMLHYRVNVQPGVNTDVRQNGMKNTGRSLFTEDDKT